MKPIQSTIFAASAATTTLFFINLCAALFHCGCVSLWNGADAHCNIHLAGVPHCPWCMYGRMASAIPWTLIVAVQATISFWPRPMHKAIRLLLALTAFPIAGTIIAAVYRLLV